MRAVVVAVIIAGLASTGWFSAPPNLAGAGIGVDAAAVSTTEEWTTPEPVFPPDPDDREDEDRVQPRRSRNN